jgi:hypothetical protein
VFEYRLEGSTLSYRWSEVVTGFDMPIRVKTTATGFTMIHPTEAWQTTTVRLGDPSEFEIDRNFYVVPRVVTAGS